MMSDAESTHEDGITEAHLEQRLAAAGDDLLRYVEASLPSRQPPASIGEVDDAAEARPGLQFRLLGPVSAFYDGRPVDLSPPKSQLLLSMLLMAEGRPVSREEFISGLWEGAPPVSARTMLYSYVSRLRRALRVASDSASSIVCTARGGYRLRASRMRTDVHRFQQLAEQGEQAARIGDLGNADRLLRGALQQWASPGPDGQALVGVHGSWAADVRRNLHEARDDVLKLSFNVNLQAGRHQQALPSLRAFVRARPFDEAATSLLMIALCRDGRAADALSAFQQIRKTLADDLGLDPGPALQDLHMRVLLQDPALEADFGRVAGGLTPIEPPGPLGDAVIGGIPGVAAHRPMGHGRRGGGILSGVGAGSGGEERERTTWLTSDEDVWGDDEDSGPPVIG
ncbi:AfsR/SARP family transcriptional regulator [Actinomadura nitritigenes]|uniref:AfsR/SARP family transcriptional regulator n=1 Tax=Actinomadura nitritigenes TaxID=134602 RepID=UPI003D94857D